MRTMYVFKYKDGSGYASGSGKPVDIDRASKCSSKLALADVTAGEDGTVEKVTCVVIEESSHRGTMDYLRDLLDKTNIRLKEQIESSSLSDYTIDAMVDIEKIKAAKELLGL